MKAPARLVNPLILRAPGWSLFTRSFQSSVAQAASVFPVIGTGPPPPAPPPPPPSSASGIVNDRIARRKRHAELLKEASMIRKTKDGKKTALSRRFWKDVSVQEVDGALQVHLDTRPLRHPQTKEIIRLPRSKPNLATALALEWDLLTSARQSTQQHLTPLTSLVCRALDIAKDDATGDGRIRSAVVASVLRYLDTDTLLCWAPPADVHDTRNEAGESLRDVQKRVAAETVSFLTSHVWAGLDIEPVLDGHVIAPRPQPEGVRECVQGWIENLDAWGLAGLERAGLAGKSLVAAARLVVEWSEGPSGRRQSDPRKSFGIEEAARAVSLEVDWQTGYWGEVEDTHDVQREDVRRQFGSVVLLVAGTG